MASPKLPPVPPQLKNLQHYLKVASDYDAREPSVSYWARLYALQEAIKVDKKSAEARALLSALMDWLETFKKTHAEDETISNEVAGQASVENVAHKLFTWADQEDRAARFSKNVVKAFYTAGMIYDVCETFGDLSEEVVDQRKYAKWKATYIHNCLKSGETPLPGPIHQEGDEGFGNDGATGGGGDMGLPSVPTGQPQVGFAGGQPPMAHHGMDPLQQPPAMSFPQIPQSQPGGAPQQPMAAPRAPAAAIPLASFTPPAAAPAAAAQLGPSQMGKAQKYCKWATSALDYEDVNTAVENLQKALLLLTTGQDS